MTRAVHTDVPKPDRATNRRQAFAIFAPPVAWTAHQLVALAIVGRSCPQPQLVGWQWIVLWLVTALAVGVALAGIVVAYRVFRGWNRRGRIAHAEGWDRIEFVSLLGMFISTMLLLNIIYFGLTPVLVAPCIRAI